jgi:hypothetical protein
MIELATIYTCYGIGKMGNDSNSLVSPVITSILFYSNL